MSFYTNLSAWYDSQKRDLPWRKTDDVYKIWISEIILQQTRVAQGISYYQRFISEFPDIKSLAHAKEDEVLKLWQGLGYYSRARNLQAAAKEITEKHDGIFPNNYEDVRRLKGIGEYTAAAILSFGFGQVYPVLDGNVARFISRLYGIFEEHHSSAFKKQCLQILQQHIDPKEPALFNQAIMEYGAISCKAQNPLCASCCFKEDCYAYKHGLQKDLPIKKRKKDLRERDFIYFIIRRNGEILLKKREGNDIWKGLYEFPLWEKNQENSFEISLQIEVCEKEPYYSIKPKQEESRLCFLEKSIQILSHQKLRFYFCQFHINQEEWEQLTKKYLVIKEKDIKSFCFPKSIAEIIDKLF